MALKQLIGEILSELGFVTRQQLETALGRQKQVFQKKILPTRLARNQLVTKARFSAETDSTPLLGELLVEMGVVTRDQINEALETQESWLEKYCTLRSDALCSVMDMGILVNSTLNLVEVLNLIMKNANKVTRSVASTLMLLEEKTDELVFSVPTGPKADELVDIRIQKGQGIAGWVAENEQPVIVSDAAKDPRFYPGIDEIIGFETKSILAVPLKAKTKLIGVLEVINKEDETAFTEQDVLLLTIFASQAAMAIENARLYGELKTQLDERGRIERNLAESEKFRALGQLSTGVAHDFNNILSAIIGYAEIALYDIQDGNQVRKSVEQILKASDRAKDLVNQILAFSRQTKPEKIPTQFNQIVKEALKLLRATLPSTIEIHQKISPNLGSILADPTQVHQILMNLFTNAHHAIGEKGGKISVSLAPVELSAGEAAAYPGLKPGPYIKLRVSDNGCGMDECTIDQIFEPYFTTKEKGVGTGMGLSVVQGIVTSHGGAIAVQSKPHQGTTFEIIFPRIDLNLSEEIETIKPLPTGNERILLVDDEGALAELGKQMLSYLGYEVTSKTGSMAALKAFRADPGKFDLVITDMTMPGMTGDVLSVKLLEIRPDIPIILLTGFSESVTKEKAKGIGIREFVMKPIGMRVFAETVRKVLDNP